MKIENTEHYVELKGIGFNMVILKDYTQFQADTEDGHICINTSHQDLLDIRDSINQVIGEDRYDRFVKSLIEIIVHESKVLGWEPDQIANEIGNRFDCYSLSDRESLPSDQSGVRDNYWLIVDIIKDLTLRLSGKESILLTRI